MDFASRLIQHNVTFKESTLTVIDIINPNDIETMKICFEGGKQFLFYTAFKNKAISFVDDDVQKDVTEAVEAYEEAKKEKERQLLEINRRAMEEAKKRAEEEEKQSKATSRGWSRGGNVRLDRKNVAYKANYCDGNGEWFQAPCSERCRNANCASYGGKTFCRTNSVCRRVIDGLSTEDDVLQAYRQNVLCYESRILLDYKIYAGRDDDGTVRGWSLDKDRLVILTTVKPNRSEAERVIFGAFLVERSCDKDDEEAFATSYPDCRIGLTQEEADEMKYWDYAPGDRPNNTIQWKEGLLRYQTDAVSVTILRDLVRIVERRGNPEQTRRAQGFLNKFLQLIHMREEDIPEKAGARI